MISENSVLRDYKITHKIGEGGMGRVYLAEDTMLDRKVALKILNPILTQDEQFTSRFRQEAKVQASLIHPNIVALYNFFQEDKNYCMVMEYAEGETLKELIKRTGPIPEERALKIFRKILEGVGYAHSKGVIHRDIKPSNIIVDRSDNVKVMDFGIAKLVGEKGLTKTGTKLGTLYYMSPEQVRAEKDIDQRTDIFSLGITLYEMLSGRVPYNTETDSDFELMNEIVNREIRDPREYYPHISEKTVNLVYSMIEKDKNRRVNNLIEFNIDIPVINTTSDNSDSKKDINNERNCQKCGKLLTQNEDICPHCNSKQTINQLDINKVELIPKENKKKFLIYFSIANLIGYGVPLTPIIFELVDINEIYNDLGDFLFRLSRGIINYLPFFILQSVIIHKYLKKGSQWFFYSLIALVVSLGAISLLEIFGIQLRINVSDNLTIYLAYMLILYPAISLAQAFSIKDFIHIKKYLIINSVILLLTIVIIDLLFRVVLNIPWSSTLSQILGEMIKGLIYGILISKLYFNKVIKR